MKKLYEIKHRFTGSVLFSVETTSTKLAVGAAVEAKTDLGSADLRSADLRFSDLRFADLRFADLRSADLGSADLGFAVWNKTKLTDDIIIERVPLQVIGAHYFVIILDAHMKIGCELHSIADWFDFDDRRIAEMDGDSATEFWTQWKEALKHICISDGRYTEKADTEQAA